MRRFVPLLAVVLVAGGAAWWLTRSNTVSQKQTTFPTPLPKIVPPPQATEAASDSKDVSSPWEEELKQKLQKLPRREKLQDLSIHKVHHTPRALTDGAKIIADVWEMAAADPGKRVETLRFMLACAEDEGTLTALRAVCWRKLTDGITAWNLLIPLAQANVPDKIQELATQLTAD